MSKTIVLVLLCLTFTNLIKSQDVERIHRFGVGGVYSMNEEQTWGAEISYQVNLKGIRRFEVDFGWLSATSWDLLQWTMIYQWKLIRKGGFNFYTGPGAGFGYANYGYGDDRFYGLLAANLGVDYTFKWPFQIAIDYRPEWSWAQEQVGDDINNRISFAIRLAF